MKIERLEHCEKSKHFINILVWNIKETIKRNGTSNMAPPALPSPRPSSIHSFLFYLFKNVFKIV